MLIRYSRVLLVTAMLFALSGCDFHLFDTAEKSYLNSSTIEPLQPNQHQLISATEQQVDLLFKNGVFLDQDRPRYGYLLGGSFELVADAEADSNGLKSVDTDNGFSTTTLQEEGVDEGDKVKYDGNTLFVSSGERPYYYIADSNDVNNQQINLPSIRVLNRNSDNTLSQINSISVPDNVSYIRELYLRDQQLISFFNVWKDSYDANLAKRASFWYPYEQAFGLAIYDLADKEDITEQLTLEVDGRLIASRRIDNKLYFVSSYSPSIDNSDVQVEKSDGERQYAYQQVIDGELKDWWPKIRYQESEHELVSPEHCYIPQETRTHSAHSSVVTLTTINLDAPEDFQSICLLTDIAGFYASTSSVYFYGHPQSSYYDEMPRTFIHQFSWTDNAAEYVASGEVTGALGWDNPQLRFSEYNDYLRVVTSDYVPEHKLWVLKANRTSKEMEIVSQLPNEQHSQKIGKPGEDIYAVRYYGEQAYIVTFLRIDPLYVIDLSNPFAPEVKGELEIPGYSAYLQPLNEHFVLGVGRQLDPNRNWIDPVAPESESIIEGAKVELYDVSNFTQPKVVASYVFENSYSPVEYDYKALTKLTMEDGIVRIGVPIYGWTEEVLDNNIINWNSYNSLQLFEANVELGVAHLTKHGQLKVTNNDFSAIDTRSIFHSDIVYFVEGQRVWQSMWDSLEVINGPF